jgi:Leucine-rich repeat (LRR) protein
MTYKYAYEIINSYGRFNNDNPEINSYDHIPNFNNDIFHLNIGDNSISIINNLDNNTNLRSLLVYENKLTFISGLTYLTNLLKLDLCFNQISHISGLDSLHKLKILKLRGNLLTRLDGLKGLSNLELLDVKHNPLTNINGILHLKNLNLCLLDLDEKLMLSSLNILDKLINMQLNYEQNDDGLHISVQINDTYIEGDIFYSHLSSHDLTYLQKKRIIYEVEWIDYFFILGIINHKFFDLYLLFGKF